MIDDVGQSCKIPELVDFFFFFVEVEFWISFIASASGNREYLMKHFSFLNSSLFQSI